MQSGYNILFNIKRGTHFTKNLNPSLLLVIYHSLIDFGIEVLTLQEHSCDSILKGLVHHIKITIALIHLTFPVPSRNNGVVYEN